MYAEREYTMQHTEKKRLRDVLTSSFFRGWLIFLFLATAISTILYLVVLANVTGEAYINSSLLAQITYLLFQFLLMITAAFSTVYLFSAAQFCPAFLAVGYVIFAFMSAILPFSKTVYWNMIIWDEPWIYSAWKVFWSYCQDYLPSCLLLIVLSLSATLCLCAGPFTGWGKRLRKKEYYGLILILVTVMVFWLYFVLQETFSGVLPYLEDVKKGDSHMRAVDAIYIVFKYVFYSGSAVGLFFAGKALQSNIQEAFSSSEL